MQNNLFYALNGIATAAQNGTYNGGLPDQNAMSAVEDAYQNLLRQLGAQYDASTSSTSSSTVVLQPQGTTFSVAGVSGSYDTQQQVASTLTIGTTSVPNIRVLGG